MEEKDLYKLIEAQAEEIAQLKQALQEFTKLSSAREEEQIDVKGFYLKKYQDKYALIQEKRCKTIDDEIDVLKKKLEKIEVLKTEQKKLQEKNDSITSTIDNFDAQIEELYAEQEKNEFDYGQLKKEIESKLHQTEQDLTTPWSRLKDAMERVKENKNYSDLFFEIENLKAFCYSEATYLANDVSHFKAQLLGLEEELTKKRAHGMQKIVSLERAKDEKKQNLHQVLEITEISDEASVKKSIENLQEYRKELADLLENEKVVHEKELSSYYLELKVQEKTNKEISEALEQMIEEKVNALNGIDTKENLAKLQAKRKEELNEKQAQYDQLASEKARIDDEYASDHEKYIHVRKSIHEIEEYIARTMNVIESNSAYSQHYQKYHAFQEQAKFLADQQQSYQQKLRQKQDKRRIVVHDPFSKDSLSELDAEIKDLVSRLSLNEEEIKQNKRALNDLINRNVKLHTIILEKEKYEEKLPYFYQQVEDFKKILEEKHNAIISYQENLNRISEEINALKELINED